MTKQRNPLTSRARELRGNPTPAEFVLWQRLRGKQFAGLKFRRQQPIGPFIADFFCPAARLVIELDGDTHDGKQQYDAARQTYLEKQGLTVLRFFNSEVYEQLEGVLAKIAAGCGLKP